MRLLLLLFIVKAVVGCPPLTGTTYRNSFHLSSMNLSILYDNDYPQMASSVACHLSGVFKTTNLMPLPRTNNMSDVCESEEFHQLTRRLGLIRVTVTVSRLNDSSESELKCNTTGNILHLKLVEGRWLAHMLTARSDFIMEVGPINGTGLWRATEIMLALAGPVLTFPRRGVYKSMHEEEIKKKEESSAWVEWLVGTGVTSLLIIATAMALLLGKLAQKRRSRRRQEKAAQLAERATMTPAVGDTTTETKSDVTTDWTDHSQMTPLLTNKTAVDVQSIQISARSGFELDDLAERTDD